MTDEAITDTQEASAFARQTAFSILRRHARLLAENVSVSDLIEDIALAIDRGVPK